ncbi:hypothetical protein M2280_004157 [Prescottella agglutinans]|uniref:Uncharacterized protein n=1 Tax=Prescottella agglutinans TaxID=1644129 RepID=A0ABT6MGA7_9NOCA|nr:hypothetical protein [Prescottella agglutinans]
MSTAEVRYSFTRMVHVDELEQMWANWRIMHEHTIGWRRLATQMGFKTRDEGES